MASTAASTPLNPGGDVLPIMVHVTAPATLPAGYTFEAELNGDPDKVFNCEVPEGGVEEGQVFLTPLPSTFDNPRINAPTGKWKDGLCDFCSLGCCHSSLWCALCCTQISMGQVMARMQLTWLGEPGSLISTKNSFKVRTRVTLIRFAPCAVLCTVFCYSCRMKGKSNTHTSYLCSLAGGGDSCSFLPSLLVGLGTRLDSLCHW
jgi:hypothetical protein